MVRHTHQTQSARRENQTALELITFYLYHISCKWPAARSVHRPAHSPLRVHNVLNLIQGKGRRGGKGRDTAPKDRDDAWQRTDVVDKVDMHNERFEKYYKAQNILADDEWEAFLESMREPLPTTFRVTGSRQSVRPYYIIHLRALTPSAGLPSCSMT